MQLIEPQKAIRTLIGLTISSRRIAVMDVAMHVQRRRTVEVFGWIVVDVGHLF